MTDLEFNRQACFENACDCLFYGYGFSHLNKCGLSDEEAHQIWKKAFSYMTRS